MSKHNKDKKISGKPKNIHKYILDLIMTIIMVLLMRTFFTGLLLHEALGIAVFLMVILHQIFNWKCTKGLLKCLFKKDIKLSTRIGVIIDITLVFVIAGIIITGIIISKVIFGFDLNADLVLAASGLHHSLGYIALILISIHLGLHWSSIMAFFRKIFNLKTFNVVRTTVLRIITFLIVIAGIRGSFQQNVLTKITDGFTTSGGDESATATKTVSYTTKKDDDAAATTSTTPQTLEEYLSSLHCTGCGKHCPLSAPKCSVGAGQAEQAKAEYEATVKQSESTDNSSTTTSQETSTTTQSLQDYLSGLNCNLCPNHCPLTNPQCSRGEEQVAVATKEYYASAAETQEDVATTEESTVVTTVSDSGSNDTIMAALTDFLPIMGLYIAGTHYLVMIPKYMEGKNKSKKE